ncbi:uncharacterized protein PG986_003777 [Apiospora aurea]|uniref:Uncharacterized protein n=1 Tax=Apiospora aurea TaxID=335848 RepID=A0ABR1QTK3_9PEZI
MSSLPSYTRYFSTIHATHKRKRGRPVGRRELREKLVAMSICEWDVEDGKPVEVIRDWGKPDMEIRNRFAWEEKFYPYPLTQHKGPCWLYWCNVNARQQRRSLQTRIAEELEEGARHARYELGRDE